MDNRAEVRDVLTSCRARLTPDQAGLTLNGSNRRVKGLRREEVAMLCDVSTDLARGQRRRTIPTRLWRRNPDVRLRA